MLQNKKIAVIVPAYNEEKHIGMVIETIPKFVDLIIVVNDASTDGMPQILNSYNTGRVKSLLVVNHAENAGVGAAIVSGYKKGLDEGMDIMAVMAGDAQMDPDELESIVVPVATGEADYTKGNRLFNKEVLKIMPRIRFLAGVILSAFTKIVSGYWHVVDPQSGFTAISSQALRRLDLERLYKRYGFPNAILTELNIANMRVKNVLITPIYHAGGSSGIKYEKIIFTLSALLIRLFWHRLWQKYVIRDSHPLILFYLFGISLFGGGMLIGFMLFFIRSRLTVSIVVVTAMLIISGLQLLLFAMWFDKEENKHLCIR